MRFTRRVRTIMVASALTPVLFVGRPAHAQEYPINPATAVVLRRSLPLPAGEPDRSTREGLVFADTRGRRTMVRWDLILDLAPPSGELTPELTDGMTLGRTVWRAATRLQRGDVPNAEPLFEDAARKLAGARGPLAALVAEGLTRCRIERGDLRGATEAYLWARACTPDTHAPVLLTIDDETGLPTSLPPLIIGPSNTAQASSNVADDIAALYRAALTGNTDDLPGAESASARFMRELIEVQTLPSQERDRLARRLIRRLDARDPWWQEAWTRLAVGAALARETDPATVRRGVVQLLHVPVRDEGRTPELTRIALELAAERLHAIGDHAEAARVEQWRADRWPTLVVVDTVRHSDDFQEAFAP